MGINDLSKWEIKKNINGLFYGCFSSETLPNISNLNADKTASMIDLFYRCSSLKSLPDISKWNKSILIEIKYLFYKCSSLET